MNVSRTPIAQLRAFALRVFTFFLTIFLLPGGWFTAVAATSHTVEFPALAVERSLPALRLETDATRVERAGSKLIHKKLEISYAYLLNEAKRHSVGLEAFLSAKHFRVTPSVNHKAFPNVSIAVNKGDEREKSLAPTELLAGDIAVIGLNADDDDTGIDLDGDGRVDARWAIMVMRDMGIGTVIHFTDAGFKEDGTFLVNAANEGHLTWTLTSAVGAGKIFGMDTADGSNFNDLNGAMTGTGGLSDYGTVSGGLGGTPGAANTLFASTGDQIIVYQGTRGTTVGATFIYALSTSQNGLLTGNGVWQTSGAVTGQQQSYLPTGLTNGTSALALTTNISGVSSSTTDGAAGAPNYGFDNMVYQGILSGTRAQLLAAIGNPSNWAGNDSTPFSIGVGGGFSYSTNFTITNPPTLVSATFADNALKIGETSTVTFVFSTAVTGFTTADLTVPNGAITDLGSSNGGITWTGTFTPNTSVTDATNVITVDLTGVTIVSGSLAGTGTADSSNYAVDTLAPSVSSVSATTANGHYVTGQTVDITVTFTENVTVTGTPQLTLETGAIDRAINYASGSGTSTLTFSYTVQAGDVSADLDYTTTTALGLNGGTIKDAAGNDAIRTLATPGAANSLGNNKALVIDGVTPSVSSIVVSGSPTAAATSVNFTVTFSESVTDVSTDDFALGITATANGTITSVSGSGSSYTVTVSGIVGNGTIKVNLKASTNIADVAGNAGPAAYTSGSTHTVAIPVNTAPTISNLNGDAVAWGDVGNTVTLDVGGNATVTDIELGALNSGNGNWSGGSLTIQRSGTAVPFDVLDFNTTGALFTASAGNLQASGLTFATYTNTGGVLTITFTSSGTAATTALVRDVLRRITYRNDTPAGDATVRFTLSDGSVSTTADVTVTSDFIYITNISDTQTINIANGVSFSEAVAIAAADVTGSQTLVFTNSFNTIISLAGSLSINESLTLNADAASGLVISGGATITLGGGTTLSFTNSTGTVQISATLGGTGSLSKDGGGTLTLASVSNAATMSGGITVNGGTLQVSNDNRLSSGTLTLNGGTLTNNATAMTIDNNIVLGASGGTFNIGGGSGATSVVLSGIISGSGTLTKNGQSILQLDGNNTYSGATNLSAGTIIVNNDNALGTTAGTTTVSSGATLRFTSGHSVAEALTISGTGKTVSSVDYGALHLISGSSTLSGSVTLAGDANISAIGGTLFVSGALIGSGNLNKTDAGSLFLSNTGTEASMSGGITVTAGVLGIDNDDQLSSGTLSLNGGTLAVIGVTTIDNNIDITANSTISTSGDATFSGVISGAGDFTKAGVSTLSLSGANTATGAVSVSAGGLTISGGSSIGNTSAVTVASNATLTLGGGSETIGSLAGAGNVVLGYSLTTGGNNTSTTFSGIISGAGNGIIKTGSGTFTLSGTNTYTGSTTVSAGTLGLSGGAAIHDASAVTVSNGATLSLNASETVGSLAGAGNVSLNGFTFSSGGNNTSTTFSGVLGGSGGFTKTGSGTLTLSGSNSGTFTGDATVSGGGTLSVASDDNLGSGTLSINNSTLGITGATTIDNSIALTNGATISNTSAVTLSGAISGSGSLSKAGLGLLSLAGTSNYGGSTTVLAGTLAVSGALNGTSAVSVSSGATLTGSGSVTNLVVNNGGTLSPGNSPGVFTVNGNLQMNSGSTLAIEINGVTAGTGYDQVIVNGTVSLAGNLAASHGYSAGQGDVYRIIVNDMADLITGTFSGLAEGATITAGGNGTVLTASYIGGTGNDFTLTTPVNVAPVIANLNGDSVTFIEDSSLVLLDANSDATVTDNDSNNFDGGNVTVSIVNNRVNTEDVLSIRNQGTATGQIGTSGLNITYGGTIIGTRAAIGGTDNNDLVINLNSAATPAIVQALIRNLTYINTNTTEPTTTTRSVEVTVNDGDGGTSSAATIDVAVVAVNDAPTLTATGATPTFTEGGAAVGLFSGANVSTVESGELITSLTLTVANLSNGNNEILTIDGTNVPLISGSYTTTTNALTINVNLVGSMATVTLGKVGGMSTAVAQAVINGLTYLNNDVNPGIADRIIKLILIQDNGGTANGGVDASSLSITSTVSISAVNNVPVVTTSAGVTAFTEGNNVTSIPVIIDLGVTVGDVDHTTLATATISITTNFQATEDVLAFANDGSTMGNINASYNSATGVLSLSSTGASATLAQWQKALASITYTNTSETPNTLTRTVSFKVNDGEDQSTASTKLVSITSVNDTPVISGTPSTTTAQDAAYSFTPIANDLDGDLLVFSITNKPSWANFDTTTGALTGTPTNANVGTTTGIVISVSDGTSTVNLPAFNLEVTTLIFTGISLSNESFVYDGSAKSLAIVGALPVGTAVSYVDNSRTDVGIQTVKATVSGTGYTPSVLNAELTITKAPITGIIFTANSFVYDGTAKSLAITGTLPTGTSVVYANNSLTNVGVQEVKATITGSNYQDLVLKADLTITKAPITGVTFTANSFVYDGIAKSLAITGTLPTGTTVSYIGNGQISAGVYSITANINGGANYQDKILTAQLTINKAAITGISLMDGSFVYAGISRSLMITGTLPTGATVSYTGNGQSNAGIYTVTANINGGTNYQDKILTAQLIINKTTITGVNFTDGSFVYDGTSRSLMIIGTLPTGATVSYTGNGQITAGIYSVTANINGGNNYENLSLTAQLTISKAPITGITFTANSFVYDGTAKSLAITGTLPTGTSVVYANNNLTNVGVQEVTATVSGSNYQNLVLKADLTIAKAPITGITFTANSFVYDGTAKSLAITGTLPTGTSVVYANNSLTNVGVQEVTATVSGSNYQNLVLKADLRITKAIITGITFITNSFVYDGTAKSLAIIGTLPIGSAVSYTNNTKTDAGTYTITANINGGVNYQDQSLTAQLTISKVKLTITVNNAVACQGSSLPTFTVNYTGFVAGDTQQSLSDLPKVSTTATSSSAIGNYVLIAKDAVANNYEISYVNGSLTINALPVVTITSNKGNNISKGETLQLTATGGTSYVWSGANGILSGQNSAVLTIRPEKTGVYSVTVTNANGCSSQQQFELTVRDDFAAVKATNLLTPNGDGINDTWVVDNIDVYPNNEVIIFDKAGRVLFKQKVYKNTWDGTVNGSPLAEGTYYYIIDFGTGKLKQKGFITIVRE